jgi:hypothetical protein
MITSSTSLSSIMRSLMIATTIIATVIIALSVVSVEGGRHTELDEYVKKFDPAYRWVDTG